MSSRSPQSSPSAFEGLPYGACHTDPLHEIGRIQTFGVLLAFDAVTHIVEYCSTNVSALAGQECETVLGRHGEQLFSHQWPDMLELAIEGGVRRLRFGDPSRQLDMFAYKQGGNLIFEFDLAPVSGSHWWNHGERVLFLQELMGAGTIEECHRLAVQWLFSRSGYDRALLYRFLPDMHGEVVEELCKPGIDQYMGLHFPAGDIPPNARSLYTMNLQRAIGDVDSVDVPVVARRSDAPLLDLSGSMLRAVHPVHIQYMKNMGVRSSFSASILVGEELYALAVCHSTSPRNLTLSDRMAFEEIARTLSLHLKSTLELRRRDTRANLREQLAHLKGVLSAFPHDARSGLSKHLNLIQNLLSAGGAWLSHAGEDFYHGEVPDRADLEPLHEWLSRCPREEISSFSILPDELRAFPALVSLASGIILFPLGEDSFLVLLRPEIIQTVAWAGKPAGVESAEDESLPLTPRASFAVWTEEARFSSQPWTDTQLDFAAELRDDLINYISRAHLERIAREDPLTGLANRTLFNLKLQEAIDSCRAFGTRCAVHMLDLDLFKSVNDTMGHAAGDQVLQTTADRLRRIVRHNDTVARLGGDEFAIVQTAIADDTSTVTMAEKIVREISRPYEIGDSRITVGVSVGIAIIPHDSLEPAEVIHLADTALYQAKRSGKNRYCRYTADMTMRIREEE